jgi:hypothetical protein
MTRHYPDGVVIIDAQETAELSPAMVGFIARYNARQKLLLDEWMRYLARKRARDDAQSAVNGFIAICVLAAIAISFLIAV